MRTSPESAVEIDGPPVYEVHQALGVTLGADRQLEEGGVMVHLRPETHR